MSQRSMQFQFGQHAYRFTLKIGFFTLCLFFFVLFCGLGVWQLYRYHFKADLQAAFHHRLQASPQPLAQVLAAHHDLQFQPVSMEGTYLNDLTVLVQNKFYHDRMGFEVLTPLQVLGEKKLVMIDRGWIEKPRQTALPVIAPVKGVQRITGYLKLLNEHQFILGKNMLAPQTLPIVMQKMDIADMTQITHQDYFPFIVRLNASDANGYVRDWIITTVEPQRHLAYAVQWFAMAMALLICYLCFCCERLSI